MSVRATDEELTVESLAKKSLLRVEQRQELELSIADIQDKLRHIESAPELDQEALEKQLAREKRMLEEGTAPEYDGASLNKIKRQKDYLEQQFTHDLPTYSMMERGRPTDIDFHAAWEREHQKNVLAWKTCLLILDPYNNEPNFLSIARLRKDTVKGDPRKYAQGFDQIKWEEVIEENLIRDMDDSEYQRFLEYRLLEWSRPSICKALAWTPRHYEAAMDRLRNTVRHMPQDDDETNAIENAKPEALDTPAPLTAGKWPRAEVEELGWTISHFARQCGVSTNLIYKYMKDDKWPPARRQRAIEVLRKGKAAMEPATSVVEPTVA